MMSDEIRVPTFTVEVPFPRPLPASGIDNHWCEHTGCRRWGCFGYDRRGGVVWFCRDHREEGER